MRPVCNLQSCRYYLPHTGIARPGWRPVVLDFTLHCIVPSRNFQMYETYLPPQRQGWLAWLCLLLQTHITSQSLSGGQSRPSSTSNQPPYHSIPPTRRLFTPPALPNRRRGTFPALAPARLLTTQTDLPTSLCLSGSDKRQLLQLVGTRSQQL